MVEHLDSHPLFRRLEQSELESDICVPHVMGDTEEGRKVERNKGDKYLAVYERIADLTRGEGWKGFEPIIGKNAEGDEQIEADKVGEE